MEAAAKRSSHCLRAGQRADLTSEPSLTCVCKHKADFCSVCCPAWFWPLPRMALSTALGWFCLLPWKVLTTAQDDAVYCHAWCCLLPGMVLSTTLHCFVYCPGWCRCLQVMMHQRDFRPFTHSHSQQCLHIVSLADVVHC